jgi:hypothetical protein
LFRGDCVQHMQTDNRRYQCDLSVTSLIGSTINGGWLSLQTKIAYVTISSERLPAGRPQRPAQSE